MRCSDYGLSRRFLSGAVVAKRSNDFGGDGDANDDSNGDGACDGACCCAWRPLGLAFW